VGVVSGFISIMADGLNNLSDCGSSVVSYMSFRMSSKPADKEHPYGHERIEYVSSMIVSFFILLIAYELIAESISKIISPTINEFSIIILAVLSLSILAKLGLFFYYKNTSQRIDSDLLKATAVDSLSDCISTSILLISVIISKFTGLNIDGIAGLLVALFIIFAGINTAKETIGLLLGCAPESDYVEEIEKTLLEQSGIIGIHDLMVHNYGPGRQIISLHAEVDANANVNDVHDDIDNAEQVLEEKFNCIAVIHMDPIDMDNPRRKEFLALAQKVVKSIDERFSIHDFRMTEGYTHVNLIFDLTIPHDCDIPQEQLRKIINEKIKYENENLNVVCKIEYAYSGRV
jgi:cation diffusion facilitator family transporter